MRTLPEPLVTANLSSSREPRLAIKVLNDTAPFWVTSHDDVDPGDALPVFAGALSATTATTQDVTPEKGFSTIGGMTVRVADIGLTEHLRAIFEANDTLNNNTTEVYMGFADLAFGNFGKLFTFIVDGISSDQVEYTFKLSDRQRLQKRGVFNAGKTRLFAVIDGGLSDLTLDQRMTESSPGTIEVVDPSQVHLVQHDAGWDVDANKTIGYFKIKGVDIAGNNTFEIFSFTGFASGNPNRLTGVVRNRFNTQSVSATASVNDGNTEVEEFIYLDLPVPKMILALLTGDLYGQPGATLPAPWHAGLDSAFLNLASVENIGNDLWELPFSFLDPEPTQVKQFIANEILRACNLFFKVNQDGELELRRFASVTENAAVNATFDEGQVVSISHLERNASHIRNRFLINWEWRPELDRFVRNTAYVDLDSITRNNVVSDTLVLNFKGVRNRSRDIQTSLANLAEGIRARYSDPSVTPTITVPMSDALEIEVGDIVGVNLQEWPDYANTNGLDSSFEVQNVSLDLIRQTVDLKLFGTSGTPMPIDFGKGETVIEVNHNGWRHLPDYLAGGSYHIDGTTLVITGNNSLSGTTNTGNNSRYYWDGNIIIQTGVTITITNNVVIDAIDIEMQGTATIDGKGRGYSGGVGGVSPSQLAGTGTSGYFGGECLAEEGVCRDIRNRLGSGRDNSIFRNGRQNSTGARRTQVESFNVRVDQNGVLRGLPSNLMGNSGNGGQYSISNISPSQYQSGRQNGNGFQAGGAGGAGGAGLLIVCENLFTSPDAIIDTSGGDSAGGTVGFHDQGQYIVGGSGGPGYPGCLVVLSKSRVSSLPVLINKHFGRVGTVSGAPTVDVRANQRDIRVVSTGAGNLGSWNRPALVNRGRDYSGECRLVKYIAADTPAQTSPGVDRTGPADLPTISLQEAINTPRTPNGNVSTITVTANAPSDSRYSHSIFEYRGAGQQPWLPLEYKVPNETTKELPTDGAEYEFSARSVSKQGVISTARVVQSIKLSTVSNNPGETDTDDEAITVPPVRRLELVNRIDDVSRANEWKGPDAEFRWGKLSITGGGSMVAPDGFKDLHLEGYRIQVFRQADGELLRELETKDTFYTYKLADNRRDNTDDEGNINPTREIRIKVEAVATTGRSSAPTELEVSNPAPKEPGQIALDPGFTTIGVTFELPTDTDYLGANLYLIKSDSGDPYELAEPRLISGNSYLFEGLDVDSDFRLGIESVDRFGPGGRSAIFSVKTKALAAADIEGLGDWATRINPVDLAFIMEHMNADAIPSEKIANLTVAKVTAGQITVQWDLGTGILLDGQSGVIESINSGYSTYMGPVTRAAISANPLVFHTWNGVNAPFWVDAAGNGAFGRLSLSAAGAISSLEFEIDSAGNASYSGTLSAARGVIGNKATDEYIEFDPTGDGLVIGRNVEAVGVDSFNNVSTYDSLDFVSLHGVLGRDGNGDFKGLANEVGTIAGDTNKRVGCAAAGKNSTSGSPSRVYWLYARAFTTQALTFDAVMGFKFPLKLIRDSNAPSAPSNFSEYTTKVILGFGDLPFSSSRAGYEIELYKLKNSLTIETLMRVYDGSGSAPEVISGPDLTDGLAFGDAILFELFHTPGSGAQMFIDGDLVIDGHTASDIPIGAMGTSESSKFFVHGDATFDYGTEGDWMVLLGNFKFVNGVEPI